MRKTIIAGNWKMFKNLNQAKELACGLKRELDQVSPDQIDIVICPTFTALSETYKQISDSKIKLGAQDMHWEDEGAFTGEISAAMLKDTGCEFVIIGHSERRQYFHEDNDSVNKKIKAALKHQLTPILCVGETLQQREEKKIFSVIDDHLKNGLKGLDQSQVKGIVLAYEPVWAIGTGKTATPEIAQEVHGYIRGLLSELYGKDLAKNIRIQYGGSVKPDNISQLMEQPDIDGALVGGASLKVDSFSQIVKQSLGVKT